MTEASWTMSLAVLAQGLVFLVLPRLSRPDILFAVTVPAAFPATARARQVVHRYRLAILTGTVAALAIIATDVRLSINVLAVIAHGAAAMGAWMLAHRAIRPNSVGGTPERVASLAVRDDRIPGGSIVALGPFLILAAAGVYLYLNWDRIPARIPTHWDMAGNPNRWADRTIETVFRPLGMGFVIIAGMVVMMVSILKRSRQVHPDGSLAIGENRFRRGNILYMVASAYLASALFSYFAVAGKLGADGNRLGPPVYVLLGTVAALAVAAFIWMARMGQGGGRAMPAGTHASVKGDRTPDDAWIAGVLYYNPDDPALLVERRRGLGWTFNFGNRWSWLLLLLLLAGPFALFMISRVR